MCITNQEKFYKKYKHIIRKKSINILVYDKIFLILITTIIIIGMIKKIL
jgi:hypothetical protein